MNKAAIYISTFKKRGRPRVKRWTYLLALVGVFALPTACEQEELAQQPDVAIPDEIASAQLPDEAEQDRLIAEFYATHDVPPLPELDDAPGSTDELSARDEKPIKTRDDFAKAVIAHPGFRYSINHVAAVNLAIKRQGGSLPKGNAAAFAAVERHVPDFTYRVEYPMMSGLKDIYNSLKSRTPRSMWADEVAWTLAYWIARGGGEPPTFDKNLLNERPKGCPGCDGGGGGDDDDDCRTCFEPPNFGSNAIDVVGLPTDDKTTEGCRDVTKYVYCSNSAINTRNAHYNDCKADFGLAYGVGTAALMTGLILPGVGWAAGVAAYTSAVAFGSAQSYVCNRRVERDYDAAIKDCDYYWCQEE